MGNSLVLILQAEVMESNCDILNALRRAHLIASKLNLKEFDGWIQSELNGYPPNDVAEIPDYRTVKGSLKAFNPYRGWISAQLNDDEIERMICEQKLWQSIGELQELYNESIETNFLIEFPSTMCVDMDLMIVRPYFSGSEGLPFGCLREKKT